MALAKEEEGIKREGDMEIIISYLIFFLNKIQISKRYRDNLLNVDMKSIKESQVTLFSL